MRLSLLCAVSVIAVNGCATADLERAFGERTTMGSYEWKNGDTLEIEGTQKWGGGGRSECEMHLTYKNGDSTSPHKAKATLLILHKDTGNTFKEVNVWFPTTMPGKSSYESHTLYGGHCKSLKIPNALLGRQ